MYFLKASYLKLLYNVLTNVKVKVDFTLEQATRSRGISCTLSLTLALDRGEWSTPRPGRFTPGKDSVPIV
jgi:hypothetical protein